MSQEEAAPKDRLRRISLDLRRIAKSLESATAEQRRIETLARTAESRRRRSG